MTQRDIDTIVMEGHKLTMDTDFLDFNFEILIRDSYVLLHVYKGNSLVTTLFCETEAHAWILRDSIIRILSYDRLSEAYFQDKGR